ncbi:MAG: hypothetical protein WAT77_17335, partial [Paracoccaceae bacterium]
MMGSLLALSLGVLLSNRYVVNLRELRPVWSYFVTTPVQDFEAKFSGPPVLYLFGIGEHVKIDSFPVKYET